ncbi:MAG: peptidylprolyl isomerase [Oscillospiraceae bacterium]|nr:peptidylprolyl isomerase [Oscillospiraceae bacterium]
MKKLLSLALAMCMCFTSLAACGKDDDKSVSTVGKASAYNIGTQEKYMSESNIVTFSDPANFTMPAEGEEIVVMTIRNYGNVYIKLFPELVPDACENFSGLVEKGYYDGLTFHRVVKNFVIQGGDPEGTGRGGESLWGDKFACEFSSSLLHLAGAVSYARASGDLRNGSQFYFSVGAGVDEQTLMAYYNKFSKSYTQSGIDAYLENGGQPYLDGDYTVFAQVFEGLDIINNLQQVKTDGNDMPVNDIVIEKAQVVEYHDGIVEEMNAEFGFESTDEPAQDEFDQNLEPATFNDYVSDFATAQNYTMPVEGEEIVVLDVEGYGEVKIKLFPELVPNGCENFVNLVESGYYDGLTFHRVIEDFIIQSGDPNADCTGGEAYGGGSIPCEITNALVHTIGAVAYARPAYSLINQSQFYFVTGSELDEETMSYYISNTNLNYNDATKEIYYENGGYPPLDGGYTVFGQVFEGLDIILDISRVDTDDNDKPLEDIVITKAQVVPYSAG